MDKAGAAVKGHVIRQNDGADFSVQRMIISHSLQGGAGNFFDGFPFFITHRLYKIRNQFLGDDQIPFIREQNSILVIRMDRNRKVRGDGPRRGRPNDEFAVIREDFISVLDFESQVNGGRDLVVVFDFRPPADSLDGDQKTGFSPLKIKPFSTIFPKPDLFGLVFLVEREIGLVPFRMPSLLIPCVGARPVSGHIPRRVSGIPEPTLLCDSLFCFW